MPAKIQYLVGKPPQQKLKRSVPADIVAAVGKKNWIETVPALGQKELKRRSQEFAVRTDREIERFREQLKSVAPLSPTTRHFAALDDIDYQLAILRYRSDRRAATISEGAYVLPSDRTERAERMSNALDDLIAAEIQARGDEVHTDDFALKLLLAKGLLRAKEHTEIRNSPKWRETLLGHHLFQDFCNQIRLEDLNRSRALLKSLEGGPLDWLMPEAAQVVTSSATEKRAAITMRTLLESFRAQQRPDLTPSRRSQLSLPLRLAEEFFGASTRIAEITRDRCKSFVELAPRVPGYLAQHYRNHSILEAVEAYFQRAGEYANRPKEAQKYLQTVHSLFKHAVNEQWITQNPFDGLRIKSPARKKHLEREETYQPFSITALNTLFKHPTFRIKAQQVAVDHHYWAPLIALYSGLRMNEILQLEREDIGKTGDIWTISVTDKQHGDYDPGQFEKRVKTRNAIRQVPIHSHLVDFGFVDWLHKRPQGRLFPSALNGAGYKPSDRYSKQFARVTKKQKVWVSRKQVFHSFRNNFNDALREAGASEEIRIAICGWDGRSMDKNYGDGFSPVRLQPYVDAVSYQGLDVSLFLDNRPHLCGVK